MEKVIGLGGPFIKANDPKMLVAWYEKHLGISFNGTVYTDWPFVNKDGSKKSGSNVLSFFKNDSDYFAPSDKTVMVNFIVKDLVALLAVLKEEGITIVGEPMDGKHQPEMPCCVSSRNTCSIFYFRCVATRIGAIYIFTDTKQGEEMKYHNEIERRKTFAIISHPEI